MATALTGISTAHAINASIAQISTLATASAASGSVFVYIASQLLGFVAIVLLCLTLIRKKNQESLEDVRKPRWKTIKRLEREDE